MSNPILHLVSVFIFHQKYICQEKMFQQANMFQLGGHIFQCTISTKFELCLPHTDLATFDSIRCLEGQPLKYSCNASGSFSLKGFTFPSVFLLNPMGHLILPPFQWMPFSSLNCLYWHQILKAGCAVASIQIIRVIESQEM